MKGAAERARASGRGRMAAATRLLLCLCLGWGCLCPAVGDVPQASEVGLRRRAAWGGGAAGGHGPEQPPTRDKVSEHMLRLYDQYSGGGRAAAPRPQNPPGLLELPLRQGNTVRSFRPLAAGSPESQEMYIFNLTSLTESENVLSASVYYYIGDLVLDYRNCSQTRGHSCNGHGKPEIHMHLSIWTFLPVGNHTQTLRRFPISISVTSRDVLSWQWKDITQLLHEAKQNNELLIGVKMDLAGHHPWKRAPARYEPYLLIYANDSAIAEPESVISSLRGHRHPLTRAFPWPQNNVRSSLGKRRRKRSTNFLLPLQNNELPGAEFQYEEEEERWEDRKPYKTFQSRLAEGAMSKKKQRKNHHRKSQTLQFDEQTLKKARRKQWNEPRYCTRRYLKVDFADIGWSEWIISPKSFDAYYCSGECQFPIPKTLKPSNHATIQSIVRAVGVIPGIPEPCCVPDKMSSLSILFFDENKNVVLKVYPNMTVESCACR